MSIITTINNFLFSDIRTTLISLVIGYVVFKLSKFYYRVLFSSLPPGPFPLPLVGNILAFRGTKDNWSIELAKIAKRYEPVMTVWMGSTPFVIISDIDMAREAFRKNDFTGRPSDTMGEILVTNKHSDVVFADYGHTWEALRRVTHSAVQKYSTTEQLTDVLMGCVDLTVDSMVEREGFGKPFVAFEYNYNIFLNILASSMFGKRYELADPEYERMKYVFKVLLKEVGPKLFLWDFFPLLKKLDKRYSYFRKQFDDLIEFFKCKCKEEFKDYDEKVSRNFCHTLMAAKNKALREGKESAPYLTDANLSVAVFDLMIAGTDTSQGTFGWILLHILYNKSIEKKLRKEIESEIGDRIPTHEDRNRCHYVMAVISETLRYNSGVVSLGIPHKAVVTSKLGDYTIPEGTEVFAFQGHILHQEEHWPQPYEFRPERFLENGKYLSTRPKAFIPFGVGRRVCLGEKLAIADLFLVLVRFLQKTSDYELVLHMEAVDPLYPDPDIIDFFEIYHKNYKISLNKK